MKRNLGLTRLRLRGLTGANDEFLLAATVKTSGASPRQSGHRLNRQLHQRRHDGSGGARGGSASSFGTRKTTSLT
jgi:hypothetical protein